MKSEHDSAKNEIWLYRKSFWKVCFIVVLFVFIISTPLVWNSIEDWFETSSWGKLQAIVVTGVERLPVADVISAADVKLGANLMKLPFDSIAERVTNIPAVKCARVLRRLPGRLIIQVQERCPIAVLGNGEILLVDSDGATFPIVGAGEVVDLPVISFKANKISSNLNSKLFKKVLLLIEKIANDFPVLHNNLSELVIAKDDVKIKLRTGGALIKTKGEITETNLRMLETFLKQQVCNLPTKLKYIDLSFDEMIIMGEG